MVWKNGGKFFHGVEKRESRSFMDIKEVDGLTAQALAELAGAADLGALEALRVKYIGRNGMLPALMQGTPTDKILENIHNQLAAQVK